MNDLNYKPGDVVETSSGVGVVVEGPNDDDAKSAFRIVMGRIPGKSIASCTETLVEAHEIVGKLPVAPGMVTTKSDNEKKQYMVHSYSSTQKLYTIAPVEEEETKLQEDEEDAASRQRLARLSITSQTFSNTNASTNNNKMSMVPPQALDPAPGAKFYPLLLELIKRGEETASATEDFLKTEQVSNVMERAAEFSQQQQEKFLEKTNETAESMMDGGEAMVDNLTNKVQGAIPQAEEQVQQLFTMIKDEDLTVLLEKGKERLEQLLHTDIPKATEVALENTGIRIAAEEEGEEGSNHKPSTIVQSRKMALQAMEELLNQAKVDPNDLESIKDTLGDNFHTMLDSMTNAAKSDRTLSNILETLNQQTEEWQEATGRLMNTKSASLFMEGANRIQARAANLLSKDQLQWAGEIGSKFTKAFTEGDAAVARLKTIELGDSVRDRLVHAIEIRSESLGGLDGIIAGALTSAKAKAGGEGDRMKDILTTLQGQADSTSKGAQETLISVLAQRDEYQDAALLKLEQVFCQLESQFEDDLSPEDIAAIARGEGGTAKLFEPIAKRAALEIEKQLDAAEESIEDETILDVLKHVRKIVSGELTVNAVLDEVVNVLNDDKIVAAGENLVKQGEQVLDAIEGVSGNKVVDDVMQIAEKAGITKDSVMEGIEKINVNELLDNAGNAITDEKARQKLLSDATDTSLDFILRILPSMPIPPVDGVKDGLLYHISNLSMQGFHVRKENILVEIAGMKATKKARERAPSNGDANTSLSNLSIHSETSMELNVSMESNATINPKELLIIDVSHISAVFNDAVWGFEQTYMPYLKGNGKFDVKMSDGAIRLAFELRKRLKEGVDESKFRTGTFDADDWEPVLCLHEKTCSIGSVDFNMQGGSRLAWVINKVAAVFKGLLRDYVVQAILKIIASKSGWILSKLNEGLSPFWDVLLRTAKLEIEDLEEAGQEDIVATVSEEDSNVIELVWRERLPLGMNLLLNDVSGNLKVVDFPRGSQARSVCEKRSIDPDVFKGSTIVAVNGMRYTNDDDLFDALKDPSRPKAIQFKLADSEDAERIRKFVAASKGSKAKEESPGLKKRAFATRRVEFVEKRELGIEFANSPDNFGLVVKKFLERDDGVVSAAERQSEIHVGDLLTHVNGKSVLGADGVGRSKALKFLESEGGKRPLSLTFSDPYLHRVSFSKSEKSAALVGGPQELKLEEKKLVERKRIVLTGFKEVDGVAEINGILIGDYLVFVNGQSVGAGCRWLGDALSPTIKEVQAMIENKSNYPIGLTFARPLSNTDDDEGLSAKFASTRSNEITMETSETVCVAAESFDQLGLILEAENRTNDIVVKDLEAVPGPFQAVASKFKDPQTNQLHLSVESVNGEFVPSFASAQMVTTAMERSWKAQDHVEILFCDDEKKEWLHSLKDES